MSQQDMDLPAEPRVAWDSDGEAWEEIIAENGEPTGVFKARVPDGDELTLSQLDQQYGLDSVDAGDRDLLLWLHAEAVWIAQVERQKAWEWHVEWGTAEASRRDWAAMALHQELDAEVFALDELDQYPQEPSPNAPCSCLTPEQAAVVLAGGFSLPLCAVHPSQDAAPGPHHPVGSPEVDFRPGPQTGQQQADPTADPGLCAVHPEADR